MNIEYYIRQNHLFAENFGEKVARLTLQMIRLGLLPGFDRPLTREHLALMTFIFAVTDDHNQVEHIAANLPKSTYDDGEEDMTIVDHLAYLLTDLQELKEVELITLSADHAKVIYWGNKIQEYGSCPKWAEEGTIIRQGFFKHLMVYYEMKNPSPQNQLMMKHEPGGPGAYNLDDPRAGQAFNEDAFNKKFGITADDIDKFFEDE